MNKYYWIAPTFCNRAKETLKIFILIMHIDNVISHDSVQGRPGWTSTYTGTFTFLSGDHLVVIFHPANIKFGPGDPDLVFGPDNYYGY